MKETLVKLIQDQGPNDTRDQIGLCCEVLSHLCRNHPNFFQDDGPHCSFDDELRALIDNYVLDDEDMPDDE